MRALAFALILLVVNEAHGSMGQKIHNLFGQPTTNEDHDSLGQKLDQSTTKSDEFDVSQKWPQCKDIFEDIQTHGNCSSSWAISVVSSIQDRRCIKYGAKDPISAYDLISCCSDCYPEGKDGCNGGDHDSAFQYFINHGIVTGGKYHSRKGCKPYPIRPDTKENAPKSTQCEKSCASSYKASSYENDKIKGEDQIQFIFDNQGVMDEIKKNGPVVAEFRLYEDFYNYSGGIYQHKKGKLIGHYYAKIVGWGERDRVKFWRAAASFGKNWGERGMFRIERGNDRCGFESNIVAGIVADTQNAAPIMIETTTSTPEIEPKTTAVPEITSKTTEVPKSADLSCQKITAYFEGTFQDPRSRSDFFDSQIQLGADINLEDKQIYFKFNEWNKTHTKDYDFVIYNGTSNARCSTKQKKTCSLPFDKLNIVRMFVKSYKRGYNPWLINIEPLRENRFTLSNAIGNCATSLQNNHLVDLDTSLYKSCFCCGDKYDPHPSLKCPGTVPEIEPTTTVVPETKPTTTSQITSTTTQITSTTTQIPEPADINCQKITAYYTGTFQQPDYRVKTFDGSIQIETDINLKDKRIYFKVNDWNKTLADGYNFRVWNNTHGVTCNTTQTEACSITFDSLKDFSLYFWRYNHDEYAPFLINIKPILDNSFTLINAIGNCSTSLEDNHLYHSDPSLYKSCYCCGDKYNPHPSLKCPTIPEIEPKKTPALETTTPEIKSTTTSAIPETTTQKITTKIPETTTTQKITSTTTAIPKSGYYNGTFQQPDYRQKLFDGELRITAEINLKYKKIYFNFDNWNRRFAGGYNFRLWNNTDNVKCDTAQKETCSIQFNNLSRIKIYFWRHNRDEYAPDLIHITPVLNNRFTLPNAIGNCATSLQNNYPDGADTSLYKSCFCCGDTYDPHPSLKCPASSWN